MTVADKETPPVHTTRAEAEHADEPSPATQQHPAQYGDPKLEVALRTTKSTSVDDPTPVPKPTDTYRHELVVSGHLDHDHPSHEANHRNVIEAAIQRGLHPKGAVTLAGLEHRTSGRHNFPETHLAYEVRVTPSVIDKHPSSPESTTPSKPEPGPAHHPDHPDHPAPTDRPAPAHSPDHPAPAHSPDHPAPATKPDHPVPAHPPDHPAPAHSPDHPAPAHPPDHPAPAHSPDHPAPATKPVRSPRKS